MTLDRLDRTQWSFEEALAHVEAVVSVLRAAEPPRPMQPWERPEDPRVRWRAEAMEQVLVALRDGDLVAKGRYTEERTGWPQGDFSGFGLHSGHHTSIRPEQWREGKFAHGRLTARDWEFIDIRMPRFMVNAIWPDAAPAPPPDAASARGYTTPYLDLMQAAIAKFGITAEDQGKKDCLVDWFLGQEIEGEPISRNLAEAMATLIRLPSAQRGGAKRVTGPDLRQAG